VVSDLGGVQQAVRAPMWRLHTVHP
jgi:hypothetical protein